MTYLHYPNQISKEAKDYYISYNFVDANIWGSDTTAIVIWNMKWFLVLNGDHRKQLADLDLEGSIRYFIENNHLKGRYSDTITLMLMDLYISFQRDQEGAVEHRIKIKQFISKILDIVKAVFSEDEAFGYIDGEVYEVLKYILVENHKALSYIPAIFRKRLQYFFLKLSDEAFFHYHN